MLGNDITILTIEDDPDVRQSISAFYKDYGYTVFEAENGKRGLELFERIKPDLIFTDLKMPEMDGLKVVCEVAARSPETPVIVISGTGEVRDSIEALRSGAWDYVVKPIIDFGELELAIRRAFERVELNRSTRMKLESMQQRLAEQSARLHELEYRDILTGLPNRKRLRQMFYQTVAGTGLVPDLAILLMDLDNYRLVNEAMGHDCGDELLKMVAEKLAQLLGEHDLLGRLGGSQFLLLLSDSRIIPRMIMSIMQMFDSPLTIAGRELFLTASTGIAMFPQDGTSFERLLQNADSAMTRAKISGKNRFQYYSREHCAKSQERLQMETHLHHALERDEFTLYYQAQYDSISRELTGMEALLRWKPTGQERLVSPATFVPILEETGLIVAVGEWVLRTACLQYASWRSAGMGPFRLSINISACQFHHGDLPEMVRDALVISGMEPGRLCLEITEGVVVRDMDQAVQTMRALADLGLELSLDDFGTGYSSLSYLSTMPLHELKIDQFFVCKLPNDRNAVSIVESVLALADGLELNVVAEGVETEDQALLLQSKGCRQLQGYLFGRPAPAEEVAEMLLPQSLSSASAAVADQLQLD